MLLLLSLAASMWTGPAGATQPYEGYEATIATDGPVAQYRFDDSTGSTTLADSAGSFAATNSSIVLGGTGPFPGSKSGALGGEAYASLPSNPLSGASAFTAEAWVDWTGGASYKQPIFDFGSSTTNYMYLTPASGSSSHTMLFEIHTTAGAVAQVTATKLAASAWKYVAVTETSTGTLTLYVNGEQVGQTTGASISPASLGTIASDLLGKSQVSGDPLFKGSLSNMAFYNKALTSAQITAHYDAGELPANSVSPTVTGTAKDGSVLSAHSGTWTGLTPITFGYQWTRCNTAGASCTNVTAATGTTYTATPEDVGSTLRIVVSASNSAGASSATSAQTATVVPLAPSNTALPSITGTAQDGQSLSAGAGTWKGTPTLSYTYQWETCNTAGSSCSHITGATSSSYSVITSQIGKTLRVIVTATNSAGNASATSPATETITAAPPHNTVAPTISGTATDGQTLTAGTGTWTGTTPISYSYEWLSCNSSGAECVSIAGANSSTYTLSSTDVGSRLVALITATNSGASVSADSSATAVVAAIPPTNTVAPRVSGYAQAGQTLYTSAGSWSGSTPLTDTYQWQRCNSAGASCSNIAGATSTSYSPAAEDVGGTLRVVVTATNSAASVSADAAPSAVVVSGGGTLCSDTWIGPDNGDWQTGEDWSTGAVPNSTDVVCLGSGQSVQIESGSDEVASLQGSGGLVLSGGVLELTDALEASKLSSLTINRGYLKMAGELDISGSFSGGEYGDIEGPGTTVLASGASATIAPGGTFYLQEGTLRNEGTLTIPHESTLAGNEHAQLLNSGTLIVNGEDAAEGHGLIGGEAELVNTGVVEKTAGVGSSPISFVLDNEGTVKTTSGKLELTGGGTSGEHTTGSWAAEGSGTAIVFNSFGPNTALGASASLAGTIEVLQSNVTVGSIAGAGASLVVGGESRYYPPALEVEGPTASTVGHLKLQQGILSGGGEVDVTGSFSGGELGTLSGNTTLSLEAGATGTITSSWLSLEHATLVNNATLSITGAGGLVGSDDSQILNHGTLKVDTEYADANEGLLAPDGTGNLTNTGTLEKAAGTGTTRVGFAVDNEGLIRAASGTLEFSGGGNSGLLASGTWSAASEAAIALDGFHTVSYSLGATPTIMGALRIRSDVTAGAIEGRSAELTSELGTITLTGSTPSSLNSLSIAEESELWPYYEQGLVVADELDVYSTVHWASDLAEYYGPGLLVAEPGSKTLFDSPDWIHLQGGQFVNEGTATWTKGAFQAGETGTFFINLGTFQANQDGSNPFVQGCNRIGYEEFRCPVFENDGTITAVLPGSGAWEQRINWSVVLANYGQLKAPHENEPHCEWEYSETGGPGFEACERSIEDYRGIMFGNGGGLRQVRDCPVQQLGGENEAEPNVVSLGEEVTDVNGNLFQPQTDISVGGRGLGLDLSRSYNSEAAEIEKIEEAEPGAFGYGWTSTFGDHLVLGKCVGPGSGGHVTVVQSDGSEISYVVASDGKMLAAPAVRATLVENSDGTYTYTLPSQTKELFTSSGRLISQTDRAGNTTTLSYESHGRVSTVTDPTGRTLIFSYNEAGEVQSVTDPSGESVNYTYSGGNLVSVTYGGETTPRWRFAYNSLAELTGLTDGDGHTTEYGYNEEGRVVSRLDPLGRRTSWSYTEGLHGESETKVTNPNGSLTDELFQNGQPVKTTQASGTAEAATQTFAYDSEEQLQSTTDGDGHTTSYTYDTMGNKTSETNADGDVTHWTYDGLHNVTSITTPRGETTTYLLNSHGNRLSESRPLAGSEPIVTSYTYNSYGQPTSKTDPDAHTWTYGYDSHGDRTVETDPVGNETTIAYDADSRKTSVTNPRGNVLGASASEFTTTYTLNDRGNVVSKADGLGHTTTYAYDGNENEIEAVDPDGNHTYTTYDADNEPTRIAHSDGSAEETAYDAAGQMVSQTNGDGHTTTYERDLLERVVKVTDPLSRATTKAYDAVGNLTSVTDPLGHTTTITYDAANRQTAISYSAAGTHNVSFGYDADGDRTSMADATGTTTMTYDQLDRLTGVVNGYGHSVGYAYDAAGNEVSITYPNGHTVSRTFDADERLASVTDWLGKSTSFSYNQDSGLKRIDFPSSTGDVDQYSYDADDQDSGVTMTGPGSSSLASIGYTRDADEQVSGESSSGLPGSSSQTFTYDQRKRLTSTAGAAFVYDGAGNPTTLRGQTASYDAAGEVQSVAGVSYAYNELGERTQTSATGASTLTYAWNQAGELTSATRGGSTPIEDTYTYAGDGLRARSTVAGGASTDFTWDRSSTLPLLIAVGSTSYIYGPSNLPVEQIDGAGTALYYHHDEQGSTRVLTDSSGAVVGTASYDGYGKLVGSTGTTTPFGFGGQYTDSDTGLIYLRARYYDPATGQFISCDPANMLSAEPYGYAGDSPFDQADPNGLLFGAVGAWFESNAASITTIATGVAEISAAFGLEPLAALAGGVAIASGALAAHEDVAHGDYLGASLETLGAFLGGSHLVAEVMTHWATDRTIVSAFHAQTEAAFNKSLSNLARVRAINSAARVLDRGYGLTSLALQLHKELEAYAERELHECLVW